MKLEKGTLVLEDGRMFEGLWHGGKERAGEVVFNTSHSGYEEMATDPSYAHQILVTTAPMQGNYGIDRNVWQSDRLWIEGFICLEMQETKSNAAWKNLLLENQIPILTDFDTRALTLYLRERGTPWGALLKGRAEPSLHKKALSLIETQKKLDVDWAHEASVKTATVIQGQKPSGPKAAVLDFGCKKNILNELLLRCSEVKVFPSRAKPEDIKAYNPHGVLLSNGPGNPQDVKSGAETVRELIGWRFIFGICMGHQILGLALGGQTSRLKFGHRGSNHPIKDRLLNEIYMTSQNHSYVVTQQSLPKELVITHTNLNDNSVAGMHDPQRKLLSVQFHPESRPGPHEAETLFDYFIKQII